MILFFLNNLFIILPLIIAFSNIIFFFVISIICILYFVFLRGIINNIIVRLSRSSIMFVLYYQLSVITINLVMFIFTI